MNNYLSDEFFHLVGWRHPADDERNVGILKSILGERCVKYPNCVPGQSQTSVTVFPNRRLSSGAMFEPTCTCYCDIPLTSLSFHARKYGRFGLSFHRDFLIRRGARPVLYIPKRADDISSAHGMTLLDDIQAIYDAFRSHFVDPIRESARKGRILRKKPETADSTVDAVHTLLTFYFLAYVKPYDSQLAPNDLHYYYSEREWRITNYLSFAPEDVAHVVVSSNDYVREVTAEFPQYREKIHVLP